MRFLTLDRVNYDGVIHGPGRVLEMEPEAAEALVELGVLEQAEGGSDADADPAAGSGRYARHDLLWQAASAARDMAAGKVALTTKAGVVTVEALEAMTGLDDVTAAERNEVWAEVAVDPPADPPADPGQGDPGQGDGGGA